MRRSPKDGSGLSIPMKLRNMKRTLITIDTRGLRSVTHHIDACSANFSQSYHDLAVRLEPVILELEREQNDLLIVAHESVLRVLYGYLMACNAIDIPNLQFPRNEIIEIIPASYNNEATRIKIPGLPEKMVPSSPEDIRIPVPPSGSVTPMGLDTPRIGTPRIATGSPRNGLSTPSEPGEGKQLLLERALRD